MFSVSALRMLNLGLHLVIMLLMCGAYDMDVLYTLSIFALHVLINYPFLNFFLSFRCPCMGRVIMLVWQIA